MASLLCALAWVAIIPTAEADPWNKRTMVTVNEPVEVSGTVLQPGRYIFQLADSQANRHIVQIWTGDGMYLITTTMAISAYRTEPSDETVFNFDERPADQPMALRQWFYPGDNSGQEFVYHYRYAPRSQQEYPNGSGR
jgi:hypothetical protein